MQTHVLKALWRSAFVHAAVISMSVHACSAGGLPAVLAVLIATATVVPTLVEQTRTHRFHRRTTGRRQPNATMTPTIYRPTGSTSLQRAA